MSRRLASPLVASMVLAFPACFREDKKVPKVGSPPAAAADAAAVEDVFQLAKRRGLSDQDLLAASTTYMPTGTHDPYVGIMGIGAGGHAAVFAMPSMRILKYVGVFTPEPWQGYAFDDESKAVLDRSSRENVKYTFGEVGTPALTQAKGTYDGRSAFLVDAANARVALLDLDDYETKQIVTNPVFRSSYHALAVTPDSEYVVQGTAAPELPTGSPPPTTVASLPAELRGGITFWRIGRDAKESRSSAPPGVPSGKPDTGGRLRDFLSTVDSFTVELPPYLQSNVVVGRGATDGFAFVIGRCQTKTPAFDARSPCNSLTLPAVLHVLNWRVAAQQAGKAKKLGDHAVLSLAGAVAGGALSQLALIRGASELALSPDGATLLVTSQAEPQVQVLDAKKLLTLLLPAAGSLPPDDFGVPTLAAAGATVRAADVGGPSTGAAFADDRTAYVTALHPGRLVRLDLTQAKPVGSLALGFDPAGVMIPGDDTAAPDGSQAVVINNRPHGRSVAVGPIMGLNPVLVDIASPTMRVLYSMSVPIATRIGAVAYKADLTKSLNAYRPGTDSRSGGLSLFRTVAGQERTLRTGNRVHVFATVMRSHIKPDTIEVNQGDTVSIHITNLEQSEDQTHGFTVDTYNVHGSWEPGKTASVTFVANRPGIFPLYCTEFCSALHLEMEGYLLVKPKGWKPSKEDMAALMGDDKAEQQTAYETKLRDIEATQAHIDREVAFVQAHAADATQGALANLDKSTKKLDDLRLARAKADTAAKSGDWQTALVLADQVKQTQLDAIEAALTARNVLGL